MGGPRGHRAVSLRVAWGRAEARREGSRAAGSQPASKAGQQGRPAATGGFAQSAGGYLGELGQLGPPLTLQPFPLQEGTINEREDLGKDAPKGFGKKK